MTIDVLLFASYADALGGPRVTVDVRDDATVQDVLTVILALPRAAQLPKRPLVAVNQRYAKPGTFVRSGDEVALIPPVAGG